MKITIKRRSKWSGVPPNQHESLWHAISIGGWIYPWLWRDGLWTNGISQVSPKEMSEFIYKGPVSIVYRGGP